METFFEGASGFGTPVAVCSTILLGLGFTPIEAAGMALLANTAPVAFGSLGIPVIALQGVSGLDLLALTHVVAVLLTFTCVIIPLWLMGLCRTQIDAGNLAPCINRRSYLCNYAIGGCRVAWPWLVDIIASILTITVLALFLRCVEAKTILNAKHEDVTHLPRKVTIDGTNTLLRASMP